MKLSLIPMLACLAACGASTPTVQDERGVAKDLVDQTACVQLAKTREEADACTKSVVAKRPTGIMLDGGAE